jgi:type I restriction enzyme S subunit
MKTGWIETTFGKACEFQRGLTYSKSDEVDFSNNVVLRANNIDLASGTLNFSELRHISDSIQIPKSKLVKKDSIIICTASGSKSHLGKSAFIDQDYGYAFGGFMGQITAVPEVHPRYLYHFMSSEAYANHIDKLSDGVNINNLKFDDLRGLPFTYPSRPHQQRIVTILDEAFEGIAAAAANAEKNLSNARELFESHLESVFSEKDNGWVESTIGQHIRFIDYRGKTPVKTTSGLRLITAKNVKMGYLQVEPIEYVAPDSYDSWMTRGIPKLGDVLFTTEAPLANVAQLDTTDKVVFAQRIIIMQPDALALDSIFLKYLLLSRPVQQRIHEKGTGATVKGIKASLLKTIEISFPKSLEKQKHFVSVLDELTEKVNSLEFIYQQKIDALAELKKSILHQAFTGQLH